MAQQKPEGWVAFDPVLTRPGGARGCLSVCQRSCAKWRIRHSNEEPKGQFPVTAWVARGGAVLDAPGDRSGSARDSHWQRAGPYRSFLFSSERPQPPQTTDIRETYGLSGDSVCETGRDGAEASGPCGNFGDYDAQQEVPEQGGHALESPNLFPACPTQRQRFWRANLVPNLPHGPVGSDKAENPPRPRESPNTRDTTLAFDLGRVASTNPSVPTSPDAPRVSISWWTLASDTCPASISRLASK